MKQQSVSTRHQSKAFTVAWFIRLVHQGFQIMSARHSKIIQKFKFLIFFPDSYPFFFNIQNQAFGKGWKPVQTGIILSTLSVMNLVTDVFDVAFTFFLPGKIIQDTLENIFSQIRQKSSLKPTALEVKNAMKLICISHFLAEMRGTNYEVTYDKDLQDISSVNEAKSRNQSLKANSIPSTSISSSNCLSAEEENNLYYVTGVTLNSVLMKKIVLFMHNCNSNCNR